MSRFYIVAAAALVAGLLGGLGYVMIFERDDGDRFAQCRGSEVSGGAGAVGGPFELVDETGATVTDAEVITEPTLIYFGFTFCPDVCPLDNARNARVADALRARGLAAQPVFISVDPERDTPDALAAFTGMFHDDMIGLTGSDAQVREAARAYRVYYQREETDAEYYLVDHSTFTYLVLPGHGFVEFFRRDATVDAVTESAACFIENA